MSRATRARVLPLYFAIVALQLFVSVASGAAPRLSAATDRQTYAFGEPIWLYVTVGNDGDAPLSVENPRCSRTKTRIEIIAGDGATLPMAGPASCATTVLEEIVPGTDMLYAFELLEFYGVDGKGEYPYGMLPEGAYQVRYRTHAHATEEVSFDVEPMGREALEAFHDYVDVLDRTSAANLWESTEAFRAYVAEHPYSPFAATLLCRAGVVSDLFFDTARAMEDFRQLIELYPDSGYVSVAVRHLAFGMGRDHSEGIAYLRRVPDELPGTLAADFARRTLARVDG